MSQAKQADRDWSQYSEHLVQRGEILLSVESLKNWQQELELGYEAKPGEPIVIAVDATGIKVTNVREDSNPACEGPRGEVVRAYRADPEGWKKAMGYGQRWMAETFFSGFRRLFGEAVHSKRWERMMQELRLKVWVYNLLIGLAVAPTLGT